MYLFSMPKIIIFFVSILLFSSCKTSKPFTENMKAELERMYKRDQDLQNWNTNRLQDERYRDSMRTEIKKVVQENCKKIKEYYRVYGYPGIKENGKDVSIKFWLIVQHSDHDVVFQEKMLKAIRKHLKNKNVEARNYAYLYDRVMKNKGEKQLYGTQLGRVGWDMVPVPELQFPDKVDELRKEMGLESLKVYIDSFKD